VASAIRHPLVLGLVLAGCALALVQTGSSSRGQEGGIMRISFTPAAGLDHIDPALSFRQPGWALLDATCARLMTYPDKPPAAGFRLQPEVAAAYRVSNDVKTYTFTLSEGLPLQQRRTGPGERVRPRDHAPVAAVHPLARRAARAGHRRREGRARRTTPEPERSGRQGTDARRSLHEAGARPPRANGDALLLRRPAEPPLER
jgi:hypothetical protein